MPIYACRFSDLPSFSRPIHLLRLTLQRLKRRPYSRTFHSESHPQPPRMDNLLSAALASGAASFLPSSILDYLFGSMFMSKLPLPDRAMPAVCCLSAAAVFRWAALEDAYCKDAFVRKVYHCCAIPQTAGQSSLARARGGRWVAGRERRRDWRCRRGSVCPIDAWKQTRAQGFFTHHIPIYSA